MTFPNVNIPADTWLNLYIASGITAGTAIKIQNLSNHSLRLNYSLTDPTDQSSFNLIPSYDVWANEAGDGAWIFSPSVKATIAIQEA